MILPTDIFVESRIAAGNMEPSEVSQIAFIESPNARRAPARAVARLKADLLFGDLPEKARWIGIIILLTGLPLTTAYAIIGARDASLDAWIFSLAILIMACVVETRFVSLRNYNLSIDMINSIATIFGLAVCGPAFVLPAALVMTIDRWSSNPWIRPYRILFNIANYGIGLMAASLVIEAFMPSNALSPLGLGVILLAMIVEGACTITIASNMIEASARKKLRLRDLVKELGGAFLIDVPSAAFILLLIASWTATGAAGTFIVILAVFLPALTILAPAVEAAWREVVITTAVRTREEARARALAGDIADEERVAYLDSLTGLGNRMSFEARLAEPSKGRVLVLGDVIGLRLLNDTIDHAAGDDLLRAVASGLRASIRGFDRAYRIGGDEFALVLENLASSAVEPFLARVAARVAIEGSTTPSLRGHPVRLRFGWASGDGDLYQAADAMLTERHRTPDILLSPRAIPV